MTQEYLEERAKRGSRKKFDKAISKIKDRDPQPTINLNSDYSSAEKMRKSARLDLSSSA